MNTNLMEQYVSERVPQLKTVCRTLWDYITHSDVKEWHDSNFKNDIEGRYYSLKILLHTIYYSKKDIECLLHYGIYDKLFGTIYKNELLANEDIYISDRTAESFIKKLKDATLFIPLLDSNKPSESGNTLISDIVHKLDVKPTQVAFPDDIKEENLKEYKILVFIDDCLGSGNQLTSFWNSGNIKNIRKLCDKYKIDVYFIVLVAFEDSIINLRIEGALAGLKIIVCDILTNKNRIFSDESIVWTDKSELEAAKTYFKKVMLEKNVPFIGYNNLDFAVILNNRVPDWTLPIFWATNLEWKLLIKRKNSES